MSRSTRRSLSRLMAAVIACSIAIVAGFTGVIGAHANSTEFGGAGWWQGFGAVKNLRAVKGLNGNEILDALQELDTYVAGLAIIPEKEVALVHAIRRTRALVAEALSQALGAAAKEALADSGDPHPDKLRKEAVSLREAANQAIPEIRKRTGEVRKLGEIFRTGLKAAANG